MPNPCDTLTKEEAGKATKTTITKTEAQAQSGSKLCLYTAEKTSDPSITSQITPLTGSIDTLLGYLTKQFSDVHVTKTQGPHGEDSRLITGKLSGANAADLLIVRNGLVYQVLVADTKVGTDDLGDMAQAAGRAMLD